MSASKLIAAALVVASLVASGPAEAQPVTANTGPGSLTCSDWLIAVDPAARNDVDYRLRYELMLAWMQGFLFATMEFSNATARTSHTPAPLLAMPDPATLVDSMTKTCRAYPTTPLVFIASRQFNLLIVR